MADHRVTDLSYGHLGKASYHTEGNEWKFSVDLDHTSSLQQLMPFKEWLPPSIREVPQSKEKPSQTLRAQRKWLLKTRPEVCPADELAADLSKADLSQQNEIPVQTGSLLAIGRAVDSDRVSGSRTTQILAVAYGDAGHVLRLIRPRVDARGWGKDSAAKLDLLDSESPEYGHWVGDSGIIRQILVSDTENGSGAWLAVRQDTSMTIFRPQYGRVHDASTSTGGLLERFPVSQLNPNPIATLTVERTQSRAHADVAFNPWYARQFAVVDDVGLWSIWDLDIAHGKKASQILTAGKRGGIYDSYEPDPLQEPLDLSHSDGWYKIMWICNINTILACNRRHIALIDLGAGISRLQSGDIVPLSSHDWILDIKRSANNSNHIFVLTTSRIFWVEIVPGEGRVKVVLSYRHFRNADDETMKLMVLKDHTLSVLITSSISPLVQFYCFNETMTPLDVPRSCQGSFSLSHQEDRKIPGSAHSHLAFAPCLLSARAAMTPFGAGHQYLENDVRFFQVWALGTNLGLNSTLYAVQNQSSSALTNLLFVEPPTYRVRQSSRRFGARVMEDSFVVPDGEAEDDFDHVERGNMQHDKQTMLLGEWQDDLRYRINWRRVYRHVFGLDSEEKVLATTDVPTISELFGRISDHIQHGLEDGELATRTFSEMSGFDTISEDLEAASTALRAFLESLQPDPDSETTSRLVVSNLAPSSEGQIPDLEIPRHPDLSNLYDQMAEYWMASLPPKLSNVARVARYRVIRQLAMDVCLSSIGISVENTSVSAEGPPRVPEDEAMSLPVFDKDGRISRESSPPTFFSSQLAAIADRESDFRLLTPAKTPSIYSHATSASEVKEDPAITRLRQYAISIRAKPDLGPPSLLSHWPSKPGADPAQYSYEEAQKASIAAESGDESEHRNRKEEARHRRRTERFLRQERSRAVETAAQSMFMPSGSQPAALSHHAVSSQSVPDLPMTQPEIGAFGSRVVPKGKRKTKKPRTAGFR
ncbi:uncharacterized protein LY89DRAFT_614583 [Mollisia scopiformis]|uniref:RNA polymerase I-specific transcription initiation factor RRN6-like protein n=1 Tax=Mollisia scopiformis TaxID=149040 RepID=A0A194XD60_MOLSC|nr:uncharacterized protein LY89DRAFT_614583 [Mollisia scopiformis]KUJ18094.1 hypothetical protein LY89DRAFT_614583 [Mollisia scopiformis]